MPYEAGRGRSLPLLLLLSPPAMLRRCCTSQRCLCLLRSLWDSLLLTLSSCTAAAGQLHAARIRPRLSRKMQTS
ncbi:hypothetical protein E2C01_079838 [Portunus trituberculatus]|uniref:Uncharacterized protein n=1 Tax=Portunus trituberculatus TaxID=210409 RepID=A0A5B7ISD4_PORTR|nr:hypothetical protein [Portunus trituberculatus]